jgi:hypothetical protein
LILSGSTLSNVLLPSDKKVRFDDRKEDEEPRMGRVSAPPKIALLLV